MVKYLHLNGTSSEYLRFWDFNTKQIVDAIEITLSISSIQPSTNAFILDARTGLANGHFSNYGTNLGSGWIELYMDGVLQTDRRIDERDTKVTLKIVASADFSDDINFFSNTSNANNLKGDIYDIKLYRDGVVISHIDMSTGTVLDQSGNGNHATLTGGTWLDDGTGEDTGIEVSVSYSTKQVTHAIQSQMFDSKLVQYKAEVSTYKTKQTISKNVDTFYYTLQVITLVGGREVSTVFPTKQRISLVRWNDFATKQTIKGRLSKTLNLHLSVKSEIKLDVVLGDTTIEIVSYMGQTVYQPNILRTVSEMEVIA